MNSLGPSERGPEWQEGLGNFIAPGPHQFQRMKQVVELVLQEGRRLECE